MDVMDGLQETIDEFMEKKEARRQEPWVDLDEAMMLTGYARSTVYRYLQEHKQETFPNAYKRGVGPSTGWRIPMKDIAAFHAERIGQDVPVQAVQDTLTAVREGKVESEDAVPFLHYLAAMGYGDDGTS